MWKKSQSAPPSPIPRLNPRPQTPDPNSPFPRPSLPAPTGLRPPAQGCEVRAILGGLIASEVQGETVKHFQQAQPQDKVRSIDDTAGIPTGVAPDIERLVAQRQAEFNAAYAASKAPDNLATDTPPPAAPVAPASPVTPPLDAPPSPQAPKGPDNLASDEPPAGSANPA